jgi:hypothetical protein
VIWLRSSNLVQDAAEDYEVDCLATKALALVIDAAQSQRADVEARFLKDFALRGLHGRLVAFGSPAG